MRKNFYLTMFFTFVFLMPSSFASAIISVGGTVSSNQTICPGLQPAAVTLTGNTGNVLYWEKDTNPSFTSATSITSTAATLPGSSIGSLTTTTYIRAVVQDGTSPIAYSSAVTITVSALSASSCGAFITRWNLATAGSGDNQLSFATTTTSTVNYYWQEVSPGTAKGSGSFSGATLTINGLPTGATIRLGIYPTNFKRITISNGTNKSRLLDVEQWGTTAWTSMASAFQGCNNLNITATDIPVLTSCTSMQSMFSGCTTLNGPSNINSWNTGAVTNMSSMFQGATAFNQPIGSWNTAAVTAMSNMFSGATAFNQPIGAWTTSAVTSMQNMFGTAATFNQSIGAWNTSAVTTMYGMFDRATSFNQDIGSWNTGLVNNMTSMFYQATAFNQNIGSWNTAAVKTMTYMFYKAPAFNQPIGSWNTGAVTDMSNMFREATAFNQPIGSWNTSAVTKMDAMFSTAPAFNQPIGSWNTSAVTTMGSMFKGAAAFNKDISAWNTAAVTSMAQMFYGAAAFNQPIGSWNTSLVQNMSYMLLGATAFNQPIALWNTAAVTTMSNMLAGASAFNQNIGSWNLNANVDLSSMLSNSGMDCTNYAATLVGWQSNPSCPTGRTLGANGRTYGPSVTAIRNNLVLATGSGGKGWTITGDGPPVGLASTAPTLCINTVLTDITHTTREATGIGVATGLPAGVTASWVANVITISGTPTVSGTFNYSIPIMCVCGSDDATGTITVSPVLVGGTVSANQTIVSGTQPDDITLTDSFGSIQWQRSTDNINFTDIVGATSSILAGAQIGALTAIGFFRAVSGSCTSAFSDVVSVSVITTTKIKDAYCGTTLPAINSQLQAYIYPSAQLYRYQVSKDGTVLGTYSVIKNNFDLLKIAGTAYGMTYSVKVAVRINNVWGAYGTSCSVTTPSIVSANSVPLTQMRVSQCGTTLAAIGAPIHSELVYAAEAYRFQLTNGASVTEIESPIYYLFLTNTAIGTYGTTFSVKTKAKIAGVWGNYGNACSISTPVLTSSSVPTTQVASSFCGANLTALNTKIPAVLVYNAEGYRFEITNGTTVTVYDSALYNFKLSDAGIVATNGTTYAIRVAAKVNGVYGNYGVSCNVTTPGNTSNSKTIIESVDFSLVAYPNPSNSTFKLQVEGANNEAISILVFDMTGRQIENRVVTANDIENISLGQNYSAGVYNAVVSQGMNTKTVRLVKQ